MTLPEDPNNSDEPTGGQSGTTVQIAAVHLQVNDLDALRRLTQTDPELARIVVNQRGEFDKREHVSYRVGLIVTAVMALGLLAAISATLFFLGLAKGIILIALILAMGVVLRVLLTGEWSDTSWVGRILDKIPGLKKSSQDDPE